ncbi:MAG: hypothetical protein CVU02_01335 [Bacteroidetes bacterium HGW-Bacteroidetes-19]|nr:MAG: hypothetical protein CVU04_00525 [Bacteroidetes bacterium HGW-Bacteroidetes-20]PKP28293.1 MAG: hypothetical protein CVU02_01335 [Bacteroidetes bacterium HGW-Bacteroidetes-19]
MVRWRRPQALLRRENYSLFTIRYSLKTASAVLRVRDLKGAEGGAEWSVSGMEHGSEADPGKARRRWVGLWGDDRRNAQKS